MGNIVMASCPCGFELEIFMGGGMMNFMHYCAFPCLCGACGNLVIANLFVKKPRCQKCRSSRLTPYDDPQLCGSPGAEVVEEWDVSEEIGRVLVLTNGKYICPKCKQMTLQFEGVGNWD